MNKNVSSSWDENIGFSTCSIRYHSGTKLDYFGHGYAECHDQDKEFQSQLTGAFIASSRAEIDVCRKIRDYELKPGLLALKHLHSTMQHSKKYNPDSYEAKRLKKEIANYQKEIEEIDEMIIDMQANLKEYIDGKDRLYQERRKKGQN